MTTTESAQAIFDNVGGAANISKLQHCSTRLRFALVDDTLADEAALKAVPGVIGVVKGPQTQVIVGSKVAEMYTAVEKLRTTGGPAAGAAADGSGAGGSATTGGAASGGAGGRKPFSWKRTGSVFMDFVVSVFTPIIPAIAGAGIFKSLLVLASALGWLDPTTDNFKLLSAIPDAVFGFLPLLVAYTTAKKLDVNRPVALGLVGLLLFPAFTALVAQEGGVSLFGLTVPNVNYNAQVFPAIISVVVLWGVERLFTKITWAPIRTFFVPLMGFIIVAPLMIFVLGPLGYGLGTLLTGAMLGLYNTLGWVAVMLLAGVLPLIISVGMHKAFIPPTLATVAASGKDSFYLVASLAHNMSEAGSSFAVALRTKNRTLRATAISAGVSALFGITEPALYGVTLQNRRALISVVAGSMTAGAYLGLTQVSAFAVVSPGAASISMFIDGANPWNFLNALIGLVIAIAVSFTVSAILWRDSDSGTVRALENANGGRDAAATGTSAAAVPAASVVAGAAAPRHAASDAAVSNAASASPAHADADAEAPAADASAAAAGTTMTALLSPLTGEVVPLDSVDDAVFSAGILGQGAAVRPTDGAVRAPLGGTVTALMDSKHAVGIRGDNGVEVLVHVGLDTVQLEGAPFTAHVSIGDRVDAGQLLVTADLDAIRAAGYDTITPVVVVNSDDYTVTVDQTGAVQAGEPLVSVTAKEKENAHGAA